MFGKKNTRKANIPQEKSSSVPVTRYYRSDNSGANKKKKKTKIKLEISDADSRLKKFAYTLPQKLIVIAILSLLVINVTLSSIGINYIDNVGIKSKYRITADYEQGVEEVFNSSILNKSKLTFSSTKFESEISQKFPEVTSAIAVVPLAGRELQVGLKFAEPLAKIQLNDNFQGVVGADGVLLLKTQIQMMPRQFSGLPILVLEPVINLEEGDLVLTSNEVGIISLLSNEFDGSSDTRHELESVSINFDQREINARFEGVMYYAKLTPERDSRVQVGSLVAAIDSLESQGKPPKTYLDVRVKDRVYVK